MMTPASTIAMPVRSVPPLAVAAFPASAARRGAGDRRNPRFFIRPLSACAGDAQPPPSVPASLRAIQAKRKLAAARPRAAATSAAECAVAALVKVVGAVQGAAIGGAADAARGAGDVVAWVFRKVHFQSPPELAVSLLGMFAACLRAAVEREAARLTALAKKAPVSSGKGDPKPDNADDADADGDTEEEVDPEDDLPQLVEMDMEKELWARIGIMHGEVYDGDRDDTMFDGLDEDEIREINRARARRRKATYERIIAAGGANSLILSNYAQLLYEYEQDIKRAELYFKQAVASEPADGEAMRRYAFFLWHVRGDMAGAEDMFTGAIDKEPESTHIRSSYAWFLWMTGGVETCLVDGEEAE